MTILMTYSHSSPRLTQVSQFLFHLQAIKEMIIIDTTDYKEKEVGDNLLKDNPITYVAGYLLRKSFQKHKCSSVNQLWLQTNLQITGIIYAFLKHMNRTRVLVGRHLRYRFLYLHQKQWHQKKDSSTAAKSSCPI